MQGWEGKPIHTTQPYIGQDKPCIKFTASNLNLPKSRLVWPTFSRGNCRKRLDILSPKYFIYPCHHSALKLPALLSPCAHPKCICCCFLFLFTAYLETVFCSGSVGLTKRVHQDDATPGWLHRWEKLSLPLLDACRFLYGHKWKNISLKTLSRTNLGISACKINAATFQYHWLIGKIEGEWMKRVAGRKKMDSRGFSWRNYFAAFTFLAVLQPVLTRAAAYCVCRRLDKTRTISSLTVSEWRTGCCDKQLLPSPQLLFEEWIWSHILPQYLHKNLQRNLYRKPFPVRSVIARCLKRIHKVVERIEKAGPVARSSWWKERIVFLWMGIFVPVLYAEQRTVHSSEHDL